MRFATNERFAKAAIALRTNQDFMVFMEELGIHAEKLNLMLIDAPKDALVSMQAHVQQITSIIDAVATAPNYVAAMSAQEQNDNAIT